MLATALLVLSQTAMPSQTLVVTGENPEVELATCIERNCPAEQVIELSLRVSVEDFADGRYRDARATLQRSIRRNEDQVSRLPRQVSSLYATLATVAEHEGDTRLWLESSRNNVTILRQYLGDLHPETLAQKLTFADNLLKQHQFKSANSHYRSVQLNAIQRDELQLATAALFRRAWLSFMQNRDDEATQLASEAVALVDNDRAATEMAAILAMRIDVRNGDESAIEALAGKLSQSANQKPQLLFQPSLPDLNPSGYSMEERSLWRQKMRHSTILSNDVSYWVMPDGTVRDAQLLRENVMGAWGSAIVEQVSGRRYVPYDAPPGFSGIFRLDRFTLRATEDVPIGSRVPQRMGRLTLHVVDMTETDVMTDARRRNSSDVAIE